METELIELFNSLSDEKKQMFLEYLMQLVPDEAEDL